MEEQQPQLRWYHEHFALQQNGRKFFKVFKNVVYQAKYTDRVSKLLLRNCVQAHDNWLKVLAHINLDHSTGRPRTIGSSGHVTPSFLKFCISKNSVFQDQDIFPQNPQKIINKKIRVAQPLLTGLRSSHKTRWVLNVWPQWCLLTITVYLAIMLGD